MKLSERMQKELDNMEIIFVSANINEIDIILELYEERIKWFKENNIKQWRHYLEHHPKEEFEKIIKNKNLFILKRNNQIIACFELSTNSGYWKDDNINAYYVYKVVTKVGCKKIGELIFNICKDITKNRNKQFLRIDCLKNNKRLNEIYYNYDFKLIKTGYEKGYSYVLREYEVQYGNNKSDRIKKKY